jgi:hypothetical protein
MLERTDTPWYPTMRLCRQPKTGDWESVIAEVAEMVRTGALTGLSTYLPSPQGPPIRRMRLYAYSRCDAV